MVVLGRVTAPYGVKGWVKIHPFGDDPATWQDMPQWWLGVEGREWSAFELTELRAHGKGLVAKFEGVDDRSAAERLTGLYFGAPRAALPETAADEFYWGDLVGLEVVNETGEALGRIESLIEAGAGQVLVVKDDEAKRERLLPFVSAVVKDVAVADGRIRVAWEKNW